MAKKTTSPELTELKEKINDNKVVIGFESVMKGLRSGKVRKVFLASNCPEALANDVTHYSKLSNAEVVWLELNNEDLGIFCKKPFFISVIGIQ